MRHEEVSYECDGCGTEAEARFVAGAKGPDGDGFTLPDGWLRVTVKTGAGDPNPVKHTADVCGVGCLGRMVTRWRRRSSDDLAEALG